MATGVPKKNASISQTNGVSLCFSGKKSEDAVISTPSSVIVSRWKHPFNYRNRLYFGDNLGILATLLRDPDVKGQVRLIYIDPPFSTQSTFYSRKQQHAYEDVLTGAEYVESLRERLILLRELLAKDGSIYLHLDEKMVFHLKLIMDEVFGTENYRNCITRKKCNPKNYTRKTYGNIADYILFYTKGSDYVWSQPLEPWTEERAKEYQYVEAETGRRFMKVPLHAPGVRRGETGKPWRGMLPPAGKHWQYTPSRLNEMDARGEIFWSTSGNPRRKVYLDENPGVGVQDIWMNFRDAYNQNIKITGYPTEKNPDLLRRIIEASSAPGDIVMDIFGGSGTTLAVANELGRFWIGVDNSPEAIMTTLRRFKNGTEPMGDFVASKAKEQKPGDKQPSLFDSLDETDDSKTSDRDHKPILEFELFSSQEVSVQLDDIIDEWEKQTSKYLCLTSKTSHICESRDLYGGINYLLERDKTLGGIIKKIGPCSLAPKSGNFSYLMDAIINQQLSPHAASSISTRIRSLFGKKAISAHNFIILDHAELKRAGISKRKLECLFDLANKILAGSLKLPNLQSMPDDEVVRQLTQVKGVGPWTAEMYLIFALARPDIFPLHDYALRKTIAELYKVEPASDEAMLKIANGWRPYRSIACWYLYRYKNAKDNV
jgi:adenine-specific DNA-methyltransferase